VDRLAEVCGHDFSSIPVVNMAGRLIGMIPRNFVIVLIENHFWYNEDASQRARQEEFGVASLFKTSKLRKDTETRHLSDTVVSVELADQKRVFDRDDVIASQGQSTRARKVNDVNYGGTAIQYRSGSNSDEDRSSEGTPIGPTETEREKTLTNFTGENDYDLVPASGIPLHWSYFCGDFYSTERKVKEVAEIVAHFGHKFIDLRPFMIEYPYSVFTTEKLPKVLEMFRHLHLRALPVINPKTGMPVGVLTRQDIFAFMSV